MMQTNDENRRFRYPRTHPFGDSELDQRTFFGRDPEIGELVRRILSTQLLVLYGRSGLGKTSLLQAGVFPKLRERNLLPILVRVNDVTSSPINMLREALEKACKAQGVDYTPGSGAGFWEFLKTAVFWRKEVLQTPILVFDQFEELFALHGSETRDAIVKELGELMAPQLPASVRARREAGEALPYSDKPPSVKLVLSLRESALGELDQLTPQLPQVMSDRFRLLGLDHTNATSAIVGPAGLNQELGFLTPPFKYSDAALKEMLGFLDDRNGTIQPFALQVICAHVERKLIAKRVDQRKEITIDPGDLGGHKGMEKVLGSFYTEVIAGLPKRRERKRAMQLCAEGLLTPEGRRLSVEEEQLLNNYKLSKTALMWLAKEGLLRREPRLESYYYELSHDRLAAPILKSCRWHMPRGWRIALWTGNVLLLVLTVLLILIGKFAFLLYQEREETNRLIAASIFDLDKSLRRIGQLPLLEPIAKEAKEYYMHRINYDLRNANESMLSLSERNAFATALMTLGDIANSKGDSKGALQEYESAVKIWEALSHSHPEKTYLMQNLAVALGRERDIYSTRTTPDALEHAKKLSEDVLERFRQVERQAPSDLAKRDLADSLASRAALRVKLGDRDGARGDIKEEQRILADLLSRTPGDVFAEISLSWSYINLGDLEQDDGKLETALTDFQKAQDSFRKLIDAQPDDVSVKLGLGAAMERVGNIMMQARLELKGARDAYTQMQTLFQDLVKANPDDVEWQRDLLVANFRLGDVHIVGFEQLSSLLGLRAAQRLATKGSTGLTRGSSAYVNTPKTRDDLKLAAQHYWEATRLAEQLAKKDAKNVDWQQDLLACYSALGKMAQASGDPAGARQHFDRARAIAEPLLTQNPDNLETLRAVLELKLAAGQFEIQQGKAASARATFEQAERNAQKAVNASRGENRWLAYLAASYDGLGDASLAERRFEQAREEYEKALKIREALAASAPDHALWQIDLAVSLYKLAYIETTMTLPAAPEKVRRARSILNNLGKQQRLSVYSEGIIKAISERGGSD
jgi:tetratricopeptide (TPR) repeat protein